MSAKIIPPHASGVDRASALIGHIERDGRDRVGPIDARLDGVATSSLTSAGMGETARRSTSNASWRSASTS